MKKKLFILTTSLIILLLFAAVVQAQHDPRGTIQGLVYEDVNGDGHCVNTGVEGEGPVEGVDIEFVSSDEQTVITLYSGAEGIYGMFAAGESYWRVTAKPTDEWTVTSENPQWAPIGDDNLVVTDLNFCVQKAPTGVIVLLPESGTAQGGNGLLAGTAVFALLLIGTGFLFEYRRRAA